MPVRQDDLSSRAHRQLIGYAGLSLPFVLPWLSRRRPGTPPIPPNALDSVSAYFYSGASVYFVAVLAALGAFLVTYRGYDNKYGILDRIVAWVAGLAAFGVAAFPTAAPNGVSPFTWWRRDMGAVHYTSAAILFAMFAVFSLFLFRITVVGDRAHLSTDGWRNKLFIVCGVAIVAGMVWAFVNGQRGDSIYLAESFTLVSFAVSWLVKGYFHETITEAPANVRNAARAARAALQRAQ